MHNISFTVATLETMHKIPVICHVSAFTIMACKIISATFELSAETKNSHFYTYIKNSDWKRWLIPQTPFIGFIAYIILAKRGLSLENDRNFILEAVKKDGTLLQYASAEFRNDYEIAKAACTQNKDALEYTSNQKLVKEIVSEKGFDLSCASNDLRNNAEIVKAAVEQDGYALKYASDALKNNAEIVKAAVSNYGRALQDASVALKDNLEIVKAAVSNYGSVLQFASDNMRNNREVALCAVSQNGFALCWILSEEVATDPEILAATLHQVAETEYKKSPEMTYIKQTLVEANREKVSEELRKLKVDNLKLLRFLEQLFSNDNETYQKWVQALSAPVESKRDRTVKFYFE